MTDVLPLAHSEVDLVRPAGLRPDQSQRVFRTVLDALACPGLVTRLPAEAVSAVPAVLLPVLALADLGAGVCVLDEDSRWSEVTCLVTHAVEVPLSQAALVAALRPITVREIRCLRTGSPGAPEEGAVVCQEVTSLADGPRGWKMSGPGVAGERLAAPAGLSAGFVRARGHAVSQYPAGPDFLLITRDGQLIGLPRTCSVAEVD